MYLAYEEWQRRYGGIFLVFFGKNPVVVLSGAIAGAHGACRPGARGQLLERPPCRDADVHGVLHCPADPSLIRQVAVKHFVKFHDRPSIVAMPNKCEHGRMR